MISYIMFFILRTFKLTTVALLVSALPAVKFCAIALRVFSWSAAAMSFSALHVFHWVLFCCIFCDVWFCFWHAFYGLVLLPDAFWVIYTRSLVFFQAVLRLWCRCWQIRLRAERLSMMAPTLDDWSVQFSILYLVRWLLYLTKSLWMWLEIFEGTLIYCSIRLAVALQQNLFTVSIGSGRVTRTVLHINHMVLGESFYCSCLCSLVGSTYGLGAVILEVLRWCCNRAIIASRNVIVVVVSVGSDITS